MKKIAFFVIIRGPLGSGKTTIAKQLARKINAEYFSIDQILEQNKLDNLHAKDRYISQRAFLTANAILIPKAQNILKKGRPIVIDGNFYRKKQITDLTDKLKYPHFVFTLTAPLQTCIERDAKRRQPYGADAVKAVYKISTRSLALCLSHKRNCVCDSNNRVQLRSRNRCKRG